VRERVWFLSMGFPEIMYLSRSQVRSLWRELPFKREVKRELSSTVRLSAMPALEISRKSSKANADGWSPDAEWPPWSAPEVVRAIEKYFYKKELVGSATDLVNRDERFSAFCLRGYLYGHVHLGRNGPRRGSLDGDTFDAFLKIGDQVSSPRWELSLPSSGSAGSNNILESDQPDRFWHLRLAFENVAGLERLSDGWHVTESGASLMFHDMHRRGYSVEGIFTYRSPEPGYEGSLRAIFLRYRPPG